MEGVRGFPQGQEGGGGDLGEGVGDAPHLAVLAVEQLENFDVLSAGALGQRLPLEIDLGELGQGAGGVCGAAGGHTRTVTAPGGGPQGERKEVCVGGSSPRNCWYCWTWVLMSESPAGGCCPTATPLVIPSIFWMGFSLWREKGEVGGGGIAGGGVCVWGESAGLRLLPLLLGEGLLPHGEVLLVLHQPQQRRAGLDAQPVVMVLGVTPGQGGERRLVGGGGVRGGSRGGVVTVAGSTWCRGVGCAGP